MLSDVYMQLSFVCHSWTNNCEATDGTKEFMFVGFEVFTAVVSKSIFFWDMTPCSALSCTRRFGGTYRLHLQGRRMFSKPASKQVASTLKMEAIPSSETSGTTQRTTRRHIPEEDTLENHRCENLKSYRQQVDLIKYTSSDMAAHRQ
jgi:hypothetical protein